MKRDLEIFTTAFALSLTALTPALAEGEWTQLIANAGLTPAEAEGLSLEQIAVYEFNRSSRPDDAIGVVAHDEPGACRRSTYGQLDRVGRASVALKPENMTLREVFAYKLDRDGREDLHLSDGGTTRTPVIPSAHAQLIAAIRSQPRRMPPACR